MITDDEKTDAWAANIIKQCTEGFCKQPNGSRDIIIGYRSRSTGQAKTRWINQSRKMF